MYKLFCAVVCVLALLTVGCSKPEPAVENEGAKLQGPSQDQMRNTYATTAKTGAGGGAPQGMMGRPGAGAPYGGGR